MNEFEDIYNINSNFSKFFSKKLSMQQEVANSFIKSFDLSSTEMAVLHGPSRESPITEEFFTVVNRVQVTKKYISQQSQSFPFLTFSHFSHLIKKIPSNA